MGETFNELEPKQVIKLVVNDIIEKGVIDWISIGEIYQRELEKSGEDLVDSFLLMWSMYRPMYGIDIQRSAEPEQKLLSVIYQYRTRYLGYRDGLQATDSKSDRFVRSDVKYLLEPLKKEPTLNDIVDLIEDLGKTWDFEKLFSK